MVIGALGRLNREDLRCTVVIGGSNPNESSVAAADKHTDVSVDLRSDVSDMASSWPSMTLQCRRGEVR
jgi:hypothetical protein